MTVEYLSKESVWTLMDKGSVRIAATINELSMYSVMATPLDGETLMIWPDYDNFAHDRSIFCILTMRTE